MLTFPYTRTSTLPRRSFLVSCTVNGRVPMTFDVTGPDPLWSENRVRRMLQGSPNASTFSVDLVREVTYDWENRPVVRVPDWFTGRLTLGR